MITEKEKILQRQKNAGFALGGLAFIGIYARGASKRIFHFNEKEILPRIRPHTKVQRHGGCHIPLCLCELCVR
jgi:hypothetical protein